MKVLAAHDDAQLLVGEGEITGVSFEDPPTDDSLDADDTIHVNMQSPNGSRWKVVLTPKDLLEHKVKNLIGNFVGEVNEVTGTAVKRFINNATEHGLDIATKRLRTDLYYLVDQTVGKGLNLEGITKPKENQS